MTKRTSGSLIAFVFFGLLSISQLAHATKLYKWVDAQGRISYQDQPPPKGAKLLEEKSVKTLRSRPSSKTLAPVKLYTVENCERCVQFAQHLGKQKVPYVEVSLTDDRSAQTLILEKTNNLLVPTILLEDEVFQNASLESLDALLIEKGYIKKPAPKSQTSNLLPTQEESMNPSDFSSLTNKSLGYRIR